MASGKNDLFTFIRSGAKNEWVQEFGFDALYVRHSFRLIEDELKPTLELANMKASAPGEGAFTTLIDQVQIHFPNLWIYVENVQHPRFMRKLEQLGFTRDLLYREPCYYLEPLTSKTRLIEAIRL